MKDSPEIIAARQRVMQARDAFVDSPHASAHYTEILAESLASRDWPEANVAAWRGAVVHMLSTVAALLESLAEVRRLRAQLGERYAEPTAAEVMVAREALAALREFKP